MYFIVEINTTKYVLTAERLNLLVEALDGSRQIENKHVGNNLGTTGYNKAYIELLSNKPVSEALTVRPLPESEYNALKLITESQKSA